MRSQGCVKFSLLEEGIWDESTKRPKTCEIEDLIYVEAVVRTLGGAVGGGIWQSGCLYTLLGPVIRSSRKFLEKYLSTGQISNNPSSLGTAFTLSL